MKKILFAFTMLLAIAACTNKPVTAVEKGGVRDVDNIVEGDHEESNERETTYFPAIDRYLTDSIGSQ